MLDGRNIRLEFVKGFDEFIQFCKDHPERSKVDEVRCLCVKCQNLQLHDSETVKVHLYIKCFVDDYHEWMCQGEGFPIIPPPQPNLYRDIIMDALGNDPPNMGGGEESHFEEEEPNLQAKKFLNLLEESERPLYEGSSMSVLEIASRITSLKCEYNLPHKCVDGFASLMNEAIPDNNNMGETFYEVKKVVNRLELPHEKIHACPKGCMLFWMDDVNLSKCRVCGRESYRKTSKGSLVPLKVLIYFPITSRLQRLFATKNISAEMAWHANNPRVANTMAHPSDSDALKHLDKNFPEFASEPRNVRLGLCTDGFAPHGKVGGHYSCWPVILTPYNLPPSMCMKRQFMFLSLLVPGPKNQKGNLDVYMQPLIEELKQLWDVGANTYDLSKQQNFTMRVVVL
ncbi:uncharacterized protein LOC110691745 [Chenopodium quinoa]|uniref:uncharacterized protein LOC110691745 n=1 Tax=Chenopodium quinoa TaxID=63459 RepID=UPI000B789563|nr:uncharacterized protein LOC110691745 [Chenopodium quinoa]